MKIRHNILILIFFYLNSVSHGQIPVVEAKNQDIAQRITISQFDTLVKRSTFLSKTYSLNQLTDSDHIVIIKILNTLAEPIGKDLNKKFTSSQYERFKNLLAQKKYLTEILNIYPENTYSRGPGVYFKKLDIELLGSPHQYSKFEIIRRG